MVDMGGSVIRVRSALRIWRCGERMATTGGFDDQRGSCGSLLEGCGRRSGVFSRCAAVPIRDAGHGWLIFAIPPAEVAFHDAEKHDSEKGASDSDNKHELFLMCDDIAATLKELKSKKVKVSDVSEQRWGKLASLTLPGGGNIGIYEPKHPSPFKPQAANL